ncbi:N-methyl-L-tryptophan oxidase [Halotalea alkalilenta]|uniref:N-methyltryptophan oxidase n=1 Tax=Halotalea alkalilenta TaxID=376489 RepID=A0A172YEM2_9GAMM|nr:N-methyl-L-tryptophan oxidase [Halotalea alkalilenta]ANF57721.1 N-methyltryptophan oxidase [Halotalea alkalilenta]
MEHYDVIVIGVGSMGGAAANVLAERGVKVLGLETFWPGHDQGSAHGGTRIVRQAYFESPDYVPLLRRAYEGWHKLERESGREIVNLCGGIYIGDRDNLVFKGSMEAAQLHGIEHEVLDATEVKRRFPTMNPTDDAFALYEPNAGYVRPEETTMANAEVAARKGATIRFGEPVTHWSATPGGGVEVVTSQGQYGADKLIITPGAWAPQLLPELRFPLSIERMVFYWFTPEFSDAVPYELYEDKRHPIYIEETHGNQQIYGFPMTDGREGGFKLGFFRLGTPTTPQTIDRNVYDAEVEQMRRRALELFPYLTGGLVQAKTCLYSVTPDEHFILGPYPDKPQVVLGCGFSGHGFKFVPVIGEVLADLATTGTTEHPISLFDPKRLVLSPG